MSAANSNGDDTNTSQSKQDTQSLHEQAKPVSQKLQQTVVFLQKTKAVIEQYLDKEKFAAEAEELQSAVKNLAVVLKSEDEYTGYLLELMEKSDDNMMQLLSKLAFQLFKSKKYVLASVYLVIFILWTWIAKFMAPTCTHIQYNCVRL